MRARWFGQRTKTMSDQATLNPVNPATGAIVGTVTVPTEQQVLDAVRHARAAFKPWKRLSYAERAAYITSAADYLNQNQEAIARLITSEMGRPLAESRGEVPKAAAFMKHFAANAEQYLQPRPIGLDPSGYPNKEAYSVLQPVGVVAAVKPWNAPLQQIVWAVGPALMTGCTVVVKPSEYTPLVGIELDKAFQHAGLPQGVYTTLPGDRATGEQLIESDVDMVTFTGSIATGRKVAESCGRRGIRTVLEMSGKDPLIVCDDVEDLDFVASGIVYGAFSNCGQWCSSIERVYLPRSIAQPIIDRVVDLTKQLRVGNGLEPNIDVGPLANQRQYDIVVSLVDEAKRDGAKVLCGGARLIGEQYDRGLFYAPTILTNVSHNMRIARENIFGPVCAIMTYDTLEEAVSLANDTIYGLGASIWTQSRERAEQLIPELDAGMVWVNEPLQSIAQCPWSVTKGSGYGTELGESGIRQFCYEKVVNSQFQGNTRRAWYFPYSL